MTIHSPSPDAGRHHRTRLAWPGALLAVGMFAAAASHAASPVGTSFTTLCSDSAVVKCVGFDSTSEISGKAEAGNGAAPTLDTSTKASGAGSLRMTYVAGGTQATGQWRDSLGAKFAPGSKFYFAFKQRFDSAVLNAGGESNGWKQFIVWTAIGEPSCAQTQLVMEKHNGGYPIMYSKCGAQPFRDEMSDGDKRFQQGTMDCRYRSQAGCMKYTANEWLTFYVEVDFKGFSSPSTVRAYMARPGQALQKFIDYAPVFGESGTGQFESIVLTMYTTGGANGSGTSWYDDLIVSRSPIYTMTSVVQPNPPEDFSVQ